MKNYRFFIGILAFVLVAGTGTQAFAQEFSQLQVATPEFHLPPIDEVGEIFDNGRGNEDIGGPDIEGASSGGFWADDFILDEDDLLTDVHFDGILVFDPDEGAPVKEFVWFIYFDDVDTPGIPGLLKASGQGVSESQMLIESLGPDAGLYRFWFDLDTPVELEGGVTYWLSLEANDDQDPDTRTLWLAKDFEFGDIIALSIDRVLWESTAPFDFNFILTGESLVGGELLPIDSTALMLAGLQSSVVWMLPVLAGAAGAGFAAFKLRRN